MRSIFWAFLCAYAGAIPSVFWTSDPSLPGDAISVSGSGFTPGCTVIAIAATSGSNFTLLPEEGTLFDGALVVVLPLAAELDAYALTI